ncbi:MAG: hypothetical protein HRT71_05530 [Flavobacteriales bacterium]|nr:hypothetical protein [Flavobacteriales bacterium]
MTYILIALWSMQGRLALTQPNLNNYNEILNNFKNKKVEIGAQKEDAIDTFSSLLFTTMSDSIFPAWYGTPWDFNGISNVPMEGEIACGYFVSTTLKHAGFNLNRYKLAQQCSSVIVNKTCGSKNVQRFNSLNKMLEFLKNKKEGIYILGLGYHVGFIVVEKGTVFFVHSDFFSDKVKRELAINSMALNSSEVFVLANITNNEILMNKWLNNTKIY